MSQPCPSKSVDTKTQQYPIHATGAKSSCKPKPSTPPTVSKCKPIQSSNITSTCITLNIQGMSPSVYSASRHKLTSLIEEHITESTPWIAIVESWLKPHIQDAQIQIPNYQILRQDRKKRERGGVVLFVHNNLPTSNVKTFDDSFCGGIVCELNSIKAILITIYRPPGAPDSSFENLLKFIQRYITETTDDNEYRDIFFTGDFNLPEICWPICEKQTTQTKLSQSATLLLNFMEEHLLNHTVKKSGISGIFFCRDFRQMPEKCLKKMPEFQAKCLKKLKWLKYLNC